MSIVMQMISIWILMISFAVLNANHWTNGQNLNTPRAGAAAITWNGKIYVFGGKSINNKVLNTVEVYDPETDTWDSSFVKPFKESRYNTAATIFQGKIYLIGGRNLDHVLRSVEVYDPVQNSWSEAQELRKEREGHSSVVFNNRIYSIGGQKDNFDLIEEIEWYNDADDKWEDAVFELPYPRSAQFSTVYNNEFYMFGGYYWGPTSYSFHAVPGNNGYEWQNLPNLSEARAYGAAARIDSLVYIIGGETNNGKTDLVEIYNLESGILTTGVNMNMSHSGMATSVIDNKIYSIGGYEGTLNDPINHVHIFEKTITSIENDIKKPNSYLFSKAYPNPFNGTVILEIDITRSTNIIIDIFSSSGKKVRNVNNNILQSGKHTFKWDTRNNYGNPVASGVYFALIQAENENRLLKLVYVK